MSISGFCRMLRKCCVRDYLKGFSYVVFGSAIVLFFLKYQYDTEVTRLVELMKHEAADIRDIISLTNTEATMNDTWRIPDAERAAIFSAYLDSRPHVLLDEVSSPSSKKIWALVRIIAILDTKANIPLTCYYKFTMNQSTTGVNKDEILEHPSISVKYIAKTENFGMRYSAAFVLCRLITAKDGRLPTQITFSMENGKSPEEFENVDFVNIHYTSLTKNQDKFMAVCVPSLHHGYSASNNLIEFVEFYRMMGVEHFTFYNTSVSSNVSQVLKYYENLGISTTISWNLPPYYKFERNLRYNGIFAGINDCIYRNTMIGRYLYTVNVDLDEFIVPRKHKNFRELMEFLDPPSDEGRNAAFVFRNMFFYLMYDDDAKYQSTPNTTKLLLSSKTTRVEDINKAYSRSKYIVRGQDVVEMGNHQVWETKKYSLVFRKGYKQLVVNPDVAASQHYRNCEVNELVCWLRPTVVDEAALRFTNELSSRVTKTELEILKK